MQVRLSASRGLPSAAETLWRYPSLPIIHCAFYVLAKRQLGFDSAYPARQERAKPLEKTLYLHTLDHAVFLTPYKLTNKVVAFLLLCS